MAADEAGGNGGQRAAGCFETTAIVEAAVAAIEDEGDEADGVSVAHATTNEGLKKPRRKPELVAPSASKVRLD